MAPTGAGRLRPCPLCSRRDRLYSTRLRARVSEKPAPSRFAVAAAADLEHASSVRARRRCVRESASEEQCSICAGFVDLSPFLSGRWRAQQAGNELPLCYASSSTLSLGGSTITRDGSVLLFFS